MAYHVEGLGFPGLTTPLTARLHEYVLRLVAGVKTRDEVKAALPLAPGERILTSVCDSQGMCVAASERALYHQSADKSRPGDGPAWVRIGWEQIGKVHWNDQQETLTLTGLFPTVARRTVLHVAQGASLGLLAG